MTIAESLQPLVRARFLDRLLASKRGVAFFLRQAARAENDDEGRFFVELERRVDDPELATMIRLHRDDEARHARLFSAAAEQTGVPATEVPRSIDLLPRLDAALGGFFGRMTDARLSVMEAYLLLQVIEERAVTQFRLLEPIARRHAPAVADLLLQIVADEERHLKYCRAIARRYAPDTATLERTLMRYRQVEARVFVEHGRDNMAFILDSGLLAASPLEALAWRGMLLMSRRRPLEMDRTPFWGQPAAA